MLSASSVSCLSLCLRLSVLTKATPFSWDAKAGLASVNEGRRTRSAFICTTVFISLHFLFVLFRSLQSIICGTVSRPVFLIQLALVTQASIPPICQWNTMYRKHEFCDFLNKFLENEARLTRQYRRAGIRDPCRLIIWTFFWIGCSELLASFGLVLTFPRLPIFYFSALGLSDGWSYAFAPFQTISVVYVWANTFLYINIHLAYILSTKFWMSQICSSSGQQPVDLPTKDSIREPRAALAIYRRLQLLTYRFNDWLGFSAVVGEAVVCLFLLVSCLYGTIRFYGRINTLAYGTFPALVLAVYFFVHVSYPLGGRLNQLGTDFRFALKLNQYGTYYGTASSQKSREEAAASLRTVKSLRDLKLSVGNFYNFEKRTLRSYQAIALDYTVLLLLTAP